MASTNASKVRARSSAKTAEQQSQKKTNVAQIFARSLHVLRALLLLHFLFHRVTDLQEVHEDAAERVATRMACVHITMGSPASATSTDNVWFGCIMSQRPISTRSIWCCLKQSGRPCESDRRLQQADIGKNAGFPSLSTSEAMLVHSMAKHHKRTYVS